MKAITMKAIILSAVMWAGVASAAKNITSNYTLSGDEDWQGEGNLVMSANTTIDLAGHKLTILWDTKPANAATITSSVEGGELHVVIPEGKINSSSVENSKIALTGSLKLVKEGAGTLMAWKTGQTYSGGTELIGGGLITPGAYDSTRKAADTKYTSTDQYLGELGTVIRVNEGATLYIGGTYNYHVYHVVLNGGTLHNDLIAGTGILQYENPPNAEGLGWLTLTKDSTLNMRSDILMSGKAATPIDLNGYTLLVNGTTSAKSIFWKKDVVDGILSLVKNRSDVNVAFKVSAPVDASSVTLIDNMGLNMAYPMTVSNYTAKLAWNPTDKGGGSAVLTVLGTFRPEKNYFYGCTLANGATLDLSAQTGIWNSKSSATRYGLNTVSFANGATITVDVGDRDILVGAKLVTWTQMPAAGFRIVGTKIPTIEAPVLKTDGLYFPSDLTSVAKATWTGTAGDGDLANSGNWACTNAVGTEVAGGVPISDTTVCFTGLRVPTCIAQESSRAFAKVEFASVSLPDDCDWRGLNAPFSGKLDLAGHNLLVSQLVGSSTCEITDTTVGNGGELHLDCATSTENSTVALTGSLKFVKEGVGTFRAWKAGQTYSGGTKVLGGILATPGEKDAKGNSLTTCTAKKQYLGAQGTEIQVDAGAELYLAGNYDYYVYHLLLNGGTLNNSRDDSSDTGNMQEENPSGVEGLGWLTLLADSTLIPRSNTLLSGKDDTPIDLGGHMLTIDGTTGAKTVYCKKKIVNGTLKILSYSNIGNVAFKTSSSQVDASSVTLIDGMGLNMEYPMIVSNYTANLTWKPTARCGGSAAMTVLGTFRPETQYFYGCTLADGATLDLSAQTGTWNPTSSVSVYGSKTVIFPKDDATVYVALGNRKIGNWEKLVSWSTKPKGVKFVSAPGSSWLFVARDDGLYSAKGLMILFR